MNPTQDEALLTAYLDGELSLQERQDLEQRLAGEPELRRHFILLEETWHCLDLLEQESPDAEQIETTLKIAAVSVSASPLASQKLNRFSKWGILSFIYLVLFIFTFQLGRLSPLDDPSFQTMVERLDMYLAISDDGIELLQELAIRRVFLPPLPADVHSIDPSEYKPSRDFSRIFGILSNLATFSRHEINEGEWSPLFYKNIQRYRTLSREKAEQVQKLHQDITLTPQSVELVLTLQNYYHWLKSLQSYEKTDLKRSRQLDQKVQDIGALKTHLDERLPNEALSMPSEIVGIDESGHLAEILTKLSSWQQELLLQNDPNQIINELKQSYAATEEGNNDYSGD